MDLEFTEEQQMIKDMTRALLDEHCPIEVVREMEDDPKGYPVGLWKQMAEAGLVGILIPERHGGGGLGLLEAALVYEELGRAMAPTPHFVSAVLGPGILLEAGSDAQQEAWLPKIVAGDAILTPAWLEPDRGFGPEGVALAAKKEGDDYLLSGVKRHVNYASSADRLLVLARSDDGIELLMVDPSSEGVTLKQICSQSGEAHYRVELRDVRVPANARIGAAGTGWDTFGKVLHDGLVLQAAQAIGGADRCLENTVEYAKVRKQFDKPLGAFQALAHYMADASTHIDGGRALVHEAAWNRARGRSITRFAPMAKLFACNTYQDVTRACAQIWGGVAFTIEYDTQMYFRRAKEMQLSWWDTPYLEELVAADVLDS
ncbi:MAG: acyl-CoA/acyl-ACP dehydrogenase [bacterium]|nr:acyl-CoA/acyl-ACP dehydrogenase [bacterium]